MIKANERYDFNNKRKYLDVEFNDTYFNFKEIEKALYFGWSIRVKTSDTINNRLLKIYLRRLGTGRVMTESTEEYDIYKLWDITLDIHISTVRKFGKNTRYLKDNFSEKYIYCGRPTTLGNPYYAENELQRDLVCELHDITLGNTVSDIMDLEDIVNDILSKNIKVLYLGCFCYPKRCHTEAIRLEIYKRLYLRNINDKSK